MKFEKKNAKNNHISFTPTLLKTFKTNIYNTEHFKYI